MSFLKRLFAGPRPASSPASHSQPASQFFPGSSPTTQQNSGRREMLRLVLRDTLNRTGIPTSWLGADLLAATSRGREPGIHVRLLLKHWDARLMQHGVAFENAFRKRLLTLDPGADRWLLGLSWQYALANESNCPPLPHPGIWTSGTPDVHPAAPQGAAPTNRTASDPADLLGGSIVISGPAVSPESSAARPAAAAATRNRLPVRSPPPDTRAEAKADLEALFAVRDDDLKRARSQPAADQQFDLTEPAQLSAAEPEASAAAQTAHAEKSFAKTDIFRRPERTAGPAFRPTKH